MATRLARYLRRVKRWQWAVVVLLLCGLGLAWYYSDGDYCYTQGRRLSNDELIDTAIVTAR